MYAGTHTHSGYLDADFKPITEHLRNTEVSNSRNDALHQLKMLAEARHLLDLLGGSPGDSPLTICKTTERRLTQWQLETKSPKGLRWDPDTIAQKYHAVLVLVSCRLAAWTLTEHRTTAGTVYWHPPHAQAPGVGGTDEGSMFGIPDMPGGTGSVHIDEGFKNVIVFSPCLLFGKIGFARHQVGHLRSKVLILEEPLVCQRQPEQINQTVGDQPDLELTLNQPEEGLEQITSDSEAEPIKVFPEEQESDLKSDPGVGTSATGRQMTPCAGPRGKYPRGTFRLAESEEEEAGPFRATSEEKKCGHETGRHWSEEESCGQETGRCWSEESRGQERESRRSKEESCGKETELRRIQETEEGTDVLEPATF
ncbi:hypothetical protein NDU88_001872 [Pleurodeles waltl]|uniref:Uncharacterized protein n=1 Tax=Pleurodeles waltl TaxID=8319 RepID=A0AAV7P566_PLEWA|nr:hypothetical protein NDU88_001872 [Pleurodeles waltl]